MPRKSEGLRSNGTLKKGYRYAKGGKIVASKKGKLGSSAPCVRTNPDGSRTTYTSHGGSRPCPHGGRQQAPIQGNMLGKRKSTLRTKK